MENIEHLKNPIETIPILKLESIGKRYEREVLKDLNFEVLNGEMIGIIGKSGVGKTTLLNLMGFLEIPDCGRIRYNNEVVDARNESLLAELRRNKIGFVVQNYALINEKNVFYNIALPLFCKKEKGDSIKRKCEEIAKKLEIEDLLTKFPNEISGGEAQRVAIARALVKEPKIILADEPTGALDSTSEDEILQIFNQLVQQGIAIVLVTHNMDVAQKCSRVFRLEGGNVKEVAIEIKKNQ